MRILFSELKHVFLADSLQLTYLTSRLGGAESFATSISFEKLDRSCSPSCPYILRQFLIILAASQPYFVDIPLIRSNIKGGSMHFSQLYFVDILIIGYNIKGGSNSFSFQSALCSSYKAFQSGDCSSMTKKSTKKLYSSSAVYFVGWLPRSPRIDAKNMGKTRR